MIPTTAAHQVFLEVWSEYAALLETDTHSPEHLNFIMDVERCLRTLYPGIAAYQTVHSQLLAGPGRHLPATRAALGYVFLDRSLWPVRAYFSPQ